MRIGLYFGSFNPVHNGHLIIAQHMMNSGHFDKIRFVVSPQNPFKNANELLDENLRYKMVSLAIKNNPAFEVSDAELDLPKPSYTIQTLDYLIKTEKQNAFSIILGSDNLEKLDQWKDIDQILRICDFHVYNRRGSQSISPKINANFTFHQAPFLDISATYIRELLHENKSVQYLVPDAILKYLI